MCPIGFATGMMAVVLFLYSLLGASNKRIIKSIKSSLNHLDAVLEAKKNGVISDDILIFGAVEGGFTEEQVCII